MKERYATILWQLISAIRAATLELKASAARHADRRPVDR
jgi:hypothetical protein